MTLLRLSELLDEARLRVLNVVEVRQDWLLDTGGDVLDEGHTAEAEVLDLALEFVLEASDFVF